MKKTILSMLVLSTIIFSCKKDDCGAPLTVTQWSPVPTEIELACATGHQCRVQAEGAELIVVVVR